MIPDFIYLVLFATVTARLLSVIIPIGVIYLVGGAPLKWNQVMLVAIGGIIRGAIAFGLSLQIDSPNSGVLKTTT